MRKDKLELMRAQSLIENDRLSAGDNFVELVSIDLSKTLKDYFDFNGLPNLQIEKYGSDYRVSFSIVATRVKSFESVPN